MKFISNLFSTIIYILMIIIFCATVYFCLDVFGIIEVPKEYSIASIFYSEIETMAVNGRNIEEIVDVNKRIIKEEPIYGLNNTNTIVENTISNTVIENTQAVDDNEILAELKKASEEINNRANTTQNPVELTNADAKRFYYSQLDDYAKTIYDELYNNKENLKTGTYVVDFGRTFNDLLNTENGEELLNNDFQLAINALIFDNPEFYYLDITNIYMLTKITTRLFSKTYNISIGPNGDSYVLEEFRNQVVLRNATERVEEVREILADRVYSNEVEKIRMVHDYLVNNLEYDGSDESTAYSIYGALVNKRAVCEGYAKAFKYVLDEMNIPCILVRGIAKNTEGESEGHAWNYVKINGEWYAVDVTWDDPVITGVGTISEERKYKYFLKGANEFFENHYEDGSIINDVGFVYPKMSVLNYE